MYTYPKRQAQQFLLVIVLAMTICLKYGFKYNVETGKKMGSSIHDFNIFNNELE